MPDPTLRQLLEYAKPIRDFAQTLQTALRLIEAAVEAEGALANGNARAQAALQKAQELEMKAAQMEGDIAAQRETLLIPARQELARLEGESQAVKERVARERSDLDEERGRRTSILRNLDDQVYTAKKRSEEQMIALKQGAKAEEERLREDLQRLRNETDEAKATAATAVSVTTTRRRVILQNVGTLPIYICGGHVTVTTSNAFTLHAVSAAQNAATTSRLELTDFQGRVDCISEGPGQTLEVIQVIGGR